MIVLRSCMTNLTRLIGLIGLIGVIPVLIVFGVNPTLLAQSTHPLVGSSVAVPEAESRSTSFSIPSGVTSAYVSGTVLITGGILSTIDFSIVNSNTGVVLEPKVYSSG